MQPQGSTGTLQRRSQYHGATEGNYILLSALHSKFPQPGGTNMTDCFASITPALWQLLRLSLGR